MGWALKSLAQCLGLQSNVKDEKTEWAPGARFELNCSAATHAAAAGDGGALPMLPSSAAPSGPGTPLPVCMDDRGQNDCWTEPEKALYMEALRKYGQDPKRIAAHLGGRRTIGECRRFFRQNREGLHLDQVLEQYKDHKKAEAAAVAATLGRQATDAACMDLSRLQIGSKRRLEPPAAPEAAAEGPASDKRRRHTQQQGRQATDAACMDLSRLQIGSKRRLEPPAAPEAAAEGPASDKRRRHTQQQGAVASCRRLGREDDGDGAAAASTAGGAAAAAEAVHNGAFMENAAAEAAKLWAMLSAEQAAYIMRYMLSQEQAAYIMRYMLPQEQAADIMRYMLPQEQAGVQYAGDDPGPAIDVPSVRKKLRVRRPQPRAAPAVCQIPPHVSSAAAATSGSEQPGGGALPGARLQMGRSDGASDGGARSAFAPHRGKRAAAEEGGAEDDLQPTEARGKRVRWSGHDSAGGLPSGVMHSGGAGTDATCRQQPAGRSTAARRHTRVPKPKLRRCSPAAAAPAESDDCVELEGIEWEGLNEAPLHEWEEVGVQYAGDDPGPVVHVPSVRKKLLVRRTQLHAGPAAVHQLPPHVSSAADTSSEQPGGGALPGAGLQMGRSDGASDGGARSAFAPYRGKRAAAEDGDAEDDLQPTEARGKKMRRSGTESAGGLPSGVADNNGGAGTDAACRLQPAGRSTAARRHTRVPKPKSRGPAPALAAQVPAPALGLSRDGAPAEPADCVVLEDMECDL